MSHSPYCDPDKAFIYKQVGQSVNRMYFFPPYTVCEQKSPLVLLIPGGGFDRGSAEGMVGMTKQVTEALRHKGFAVAAISYRGFKPDGVSCIGDIIADVLDALAYLHSHEAQLQVDCNKVFALGHSAGGHLALQIGYMDQSAVDEFRQCPGQYYPLLGAVALSPPVTLHQKDAHLFASPYPGGLPDFFFHDNREYSPYYLADSHAIPTFLSIGDKDEIISPLQVEMLYRKLQYYGIPSELTVTKGHAHCYQQFDPLVPPKPTYEELQRDIVKFIVSTLERNEGHEFNSCG